MASAEASPGFFCTYCQEEIRGLGAVCDVCADFNICLKCLACGAEIGDHRRNHAYRLADRGSFPVFQGTCPWEATKEMELVEAVEHFGFGNWEDVAKKTNSTASSVEEHYRAYYIDGNLGTATLPTEPSRRFPTRDHSCPPGGPLSPSLAVQFPPIAIPQEEQQMLGFMPLRDDFEREYDNDAEHLLSGLDLSPDDDEVDASLKAAHIDMYRMRLRERIRRKAVARDFRLIENAVSSIQKKDQKKATDLSKKRGSKEEKDWFDRIKMLAQIQSLHEQETLYENLQKEKKLKARLKELVQYRKKNIAAKTSESSESESNRIKRDKTKGGKESGRDNGNAAHQAKKKGNSSNRSTGSSTRSTGKSARANSVESMSTCDTSDGDQTDEGESVEPVVPVPSSAAPSTGKGLGNGGGKTSSMTGKNNASSSSSNGRNLDYSKFPGYDLLSHKERQLCRSIAMTPSNYILIKAAILKDNCSRQNGVTIRNKYHGVEKSHRKKIIEFLATSGWITVP